MKGAHAKEDDFIEHLFTASTHDTMLFFTDRGKCYWMKVHEIPPGQRTSQGRAIVRNDNDFAISVVGKNYNPVNHPDAFKTAENVIMLSDLDIEGITRDVGCSHSGARAYATYTLPNHRVNLGREGDDVALTISARNSFDGSWSFVVLDKASA